MACLFLTQRFFSLEPIPTDGEERTVSDRSGFRVATRIRSFRFAARGIRAAIRSQHNAWIHLAASAAVVLTGAVVGLTRTGWCLIESVLQG